MEHSNELQNLLDKLELETGIQFTVSSSYLSDADTLQKIKDIFQDYQMNNSRTSFLQQFLTGHMTAEEISKGAHRFHMEESTLRVLFLLAFKQPYDASVLTILSSLFAMGADDIIEIDKTHIVMIRQLKAPISPEETEQMALNMLDTLNTEAMLSVKIAFAGTAERLSQLPLLYQNAFSALEIGNVFYSAESILSYQKLGLGKLIHSLPREACEEYLREKLNDIDLYQLDEETLHTIHTFFDSGLSIAESARQLYIHRNTLVYRLEKIQKLTGLDIRQFDDAVTCKIAMMLSDYLHG